MGRARRLWLWALALGSAGLAGLILVMALSAGALSGQVAFAVLPFVILFTVAWRGLHPDK